MAALTDRSVNAQGTGVRAGDLHLIRLAHRTQDGHIGHFLLGTHQGNALVAGKLSGIGQILTLGKLITGTKQLLNSFLRQMNVTGRSFNHEFHFVIPPVLYDPPFSVRPKRLNPLFAWIGGSPPPRQS